MSDVAVSKLLQELGRPSRMTIQEALDSWDPIAAVACRIRLFPLDDMTYEEEWFFRVGNFFGDAIESGLLQALKNETGNWFVEVEDFAKDYCAPELLRVFGQIREVFPGGQVPLYAQQRVPIIERVVSGDEVRFDSLSRAFFQYEGVFRDGLMKFIRHNQACFGNIDQVGE